jgi:hypothetical protein
MAYQLKIQANSKDLEIETILVCVVSALNLDVVYGFHGWVPYSQLSEQRMGRLKVPALP